MTDYHFCPACEACPVCDGGDLRYPRSWRLSIRGDGELRAQCTGCDGRAWICPTPEKSAPPTDCLRGPA